MLGGRGFRNSIARVIVIFYFYFLVPLAVAPTASPSSPSASYQTVCPPIAAGFDYRVVAIAAAGLVVLAVAGVLLWRRGMCFRKDHVDLEVFRIHYDLEYHIKMSVSS